MATAAITASANGDNQVVAGKSGFKIRVTGGVLSFSGAVNAKFTDGPGGTALTGLYYGGTNTVIPFDFAPEGVGGMRGHFDAGAGNDLTLNLSAGVAVGGHLSYEFVR